MGANPAYDTSIFEYCALGGGMKQFQGSTIVGGGHRVAVSYNCED
jgi:hypothetical protein